ncbi:MAG: NAD(P)-dependent oxidoreductase [Betaproteobacteria bacterium]|nr:NAD(P)-dependent oxidoreductase [Betaproteobacteria bacterium]
MNTHSRVAFIGLGAMGGAMTRRLMNAGYLVTVHARRPEVMRPYVDDGALSASSPAEAAKNADFIFTNVTSTHDVEDVLLGANGVIHGAKPGAIVCDMSTISAVATRDIAARLAANKIHMLDCPVSGGVKGAQAATLTIVVGGSAEVLERARPLLERLGTHIFHMGDHGAGQVTKACNQTVQVISIQGIAEAMLFARANGVDCNKVVEALMSGFAGSKMLGLMGPKMANRDFAAGIEARLHQKDFGLIVDIAESQGLPMPAAKLVYEQLTELMEHGWGTMDTCNLLRVLEEQQKG